MNTILCPHCNQPHPAEAQFCPVSGGALPASPACPHCHQPVQAEWKSCPHCGRAIPQPFDCPQCGQTAQPGWKACPNCGQRLDKRALRKARAAVVVLSPEEAAQVAAQQRQRRRKWLLVWIPVAMTIGVGAVSVWLFTAGSTSPAAGWVAAHAPAQVATLFATPTLTPTLTPTTTRTPTPTLTATPTPTPTFTPTLTPIPLPAIVTQWTTSGRWSETTTGCFDENRCWTESSDGNYSDNTNASLTSIESIYIDPTWTSPALAFRHRHQIEACCDRGRVEVSVEGSSTWEELASYTGETDWTPELTDLSAYRGESVFLRFRFTSDGSVTFDGWYIQDVSVGPLSSMTFSGLIEPWPTETVGGACIGVTSRTVTNEFLVSTPLPVDHGQYVISVFGEPASAAGIRVGDVMVNVNGQVVSSLEQMGAAIELTGIGNILHIELYRGKDVLVVELQVGRRTLPLGCVLE